MALISIVLCSYNGEKYISEQINSILNQTYKNFELILCDDKSTDSTINILNAFSKKDGRVKLHINDATLGYVKNFEKGITFAKGDYIALSDQDDVWEHNKIETLYKNIKNHDLIYCDSLFVNENLQPLGKKMSTSKEMISTNNPLNICLENCVSGHALMFKKELSQKIVPFPSLIPHDWWIAFNASLNGGILYFNEPLIKYRIHDKNTLVLNKERKSKENKIIKKQIRIHEFSKKCPDSHKSKHILLALNRAYEKNSFGRKIKKIALFLKYKNELFIIKKKKNFQLIFYIIKQFNKLK